MKALHIKGHKKSYLLVAIFSLPLITALLTILYVNSSKLTIDFDPDKTDISFYTDTLPTDSGNSVISSFNIAPHNISFEYTLGAKREYPYCGADIILQNSPYINLEKYDYIDIYINSYKSDDFMFYMYEFIDGYSDTSDDNTMRLTRFPIYTEKGHNKYSAQLRYLDTPLWWYGASEIKALDLPKRDFTKIRKVAIQNFPYNKTGQKYRVSVNKIIFRKDIKSIIIIILILLIIYYAFAVTLFIRALKKDFEIEYEHISMENISDEELTTLTEYIGRNYSKPNFSMSRIEKDTGISASKIRTIISKKFNTTFKKYVTAIKIKEAKRLLLESDRTVSEIAHRLGYNHASTFAKVFKENAGVSAMEFRKSEKCLRKS